MRPILVFFLPAVIIFIFTVINAHALMAIKNEKACEARRDKDRAAVLPNERGRILLQRASDWHKAVENAKDDAVGAGDFLEDKARKGERKKTKAVKNGAKKGEKFIDNAEKKAGDVSKQWQRSAEGVRIKTRFRKLKRAQRFEAAKCKPLQRDGTWQHGDNSESLSVDQMRCLGILPQNPTHVDHIQEFYAPKVVDIPRKLVTTLNKRNPPPNSQNGNQGNNNPANNPGNNPGTNANNGNPNAPPPWVAPFNPDFDDNDGGPGDFDNNAGPGNGNFNPGANDPGNQNANNNGRPGPWPAGPNNNNPNDDDDNPARVHVNAAPICATYDRLLVMFHAMMVFGFPHGPLAVHIRLFAWWRRWRHRRRPL